jgi:hypothetical protein
MEDEMVKKLACVVILSLLIGPGIASAALVTFESTATNNAIENGPKDVEGLTFDSNHYHFIQASSGSFGGMVGPFNYLGLDAPGLGQPVRVTLTGGGTFSVFSLDASREWADSAAAAAGGFSNADFLHLVGNISGGGTVSADFALLFGFQNFAFSGFTNLDSMVISGYVQGGPSNASWAVDNIEFASAVPEPGTMMLLGSGLVGLVGCGRRRFKK